MEQEFNNWNEIKKSLEESNVIDRFPKEGEVWMTSLGKNIGFEQNGSGKSFSRPMLIEKNLTTKCF